MNPIWKLRKRGDQEIHCRVFSEAQHVMSIHFVKVETLQMCLLVYFLPSRSDPASWRKSRQGSGHKFRKCLSRSLKTGQQSLKANPLSTHKKNPSIHPFGAIMFHACVYNIVQIESWNSSDISSIRSPDLPV